MPSFLRSLSAHASGHLPSHVVPSSDLSRRLWAALLDDQACSILPQTCASRVHPGEEPGDGTTMGDSIVLDLTHNDIGGEGNAGSPTQPPSAINVAATHWASLRSPVLGTSAPIS